MRKIKGRFTNASISDNLNDLVDKNTRTTIHQWKKNALSWKSSRSWLPIFMVFPFWLLRYFYRLLIIFFWSGAIKSKAQTVYEPGKRKPTPCSLTHFNRKSDISIFWLLFPFSAHTILRVSYHTARRLLNSPDKWHISTNNMVCRYLFGTKYTQFCYRTARFLFFAEDAQIV